MGADGRTEAQKAADEALTAAVDQACLAYGYTDDTTMNVEYIVLVNQIIMNETDDSGFVTVYKDNRMRWVNILGMLRAATLRAEEEFNMGRDQD